MRIKKAWVVARKDLSEFRANKQILLTLAIFPIIMTLLPAISVVPLADLVSKPPPREPNLQLNWTGLQHFPADTYNSTTFSKAWVNGSNISAGVIYNSYINNSTLIDIVAYSTLFDNVTVRNAVLIGCVLRNSHYEKGNLLTINTVISGTGGTSNEELQLVFRYFTHGFMLLLFFTMSVAMPTTIAAFSFVGEKSNKTLEPLLATPLTDSELLWGKYLAVFVPVMALIFLSFGILTVVIDSLTVSRLGYLLIPDASWAFGILVITPLICLVGISVNVLISSKVSDVRTAQQYSALIILPLLLVFFLGPFLTSMDIGMDFLMAMGIGLAGILALLILFSLKVFNREGILTTWK